MSEDVWWREAFARDYEEVYAHRDDLSAAAEAEGLAPRLRDRGGLVLDAGCGNGRHVAALRNRGIDAFGFDWSPALLERAARRPECRSRVLRGDMRCPPVSSSWSAILVLFTAFGYFSDADNAATLHALARLVEPGGWLVLDLPDAERLRQGLAPDSRRTTPGGLEVIERRRRSGDRVEKDVEVRSPAGVRCYRESVRLYRPAEIEALARGAGLRAVDCWGSLRGEKFDDARQVHWLHRLQL